jgi:hypothetical protein
MNCSEGRKIPSITVLNVTVLWSYCIPERREDREELGYYANSRQCRIVQEHRHTLRYLGSIAPEYVHKPEKQESSDEQRRMHVAVCQQEQQHTRQTISIAMRS